MKHLRRPWGRQREREELKTGKKGVFFSFFWGGGGGGEWGGGGCV